MRVLQVGKYYPPVRGGMETHLQLLCGELRRRVALEVIVSNVAPRTVHEVVDAVPVTRCARLALVASTPICPTMPRELSSRHYDVLHLHFPNPMSVLSYLASRAPASHRLVITYHSDVVRQRRLLKLFRPFMHKVLQRADAIICTSKNYLASSEELQPFRAKCHSIPLGIDLSRFSDIERHEVEAARVRERFPGLRIIGVGRLIYYKGFEHAIRAMRKVDGHLLIVGDGPLRRSLAALASECGVAERVHLLGNLDEDATMAHYLASDVFVLPSVARSEAFGVVQLEAMACGLPVVNTALDSGVPFVSRDGESGFTVPPGDPDALASAMSRLKDAPELRRTLGSAGRKRVHLEFSKETMAERVLEIYSALGPNP